MAAILQLQKSAVNNYSTLLVVERMLKSKLSHAIAHGMVKTVKMTKVTIVG